MTMPVLFFPSGLLTSVGTMLLPEVSHARAMGDAEKIRAIFARVFRMTVIMALLLCAVFLAFAQDFGLLIYQSNEIGRLLTLLAPLTPLIYLDFVVDSMMSGLGQQLRALRINMLDYAIRVGLVLLLIPRIGFFAYIAILYISAMLNATLSIRRLLMVSRTSIDVPEWIIGPLLAAAISGSLVCAGIPAAADSTAQRGDAHHQDHPARRRLHRPALSHAQPQRRRRPLVQSYGEIGPYLPAVTY